jgi:hypothetical protein
MCEGEMRKKIGKSFYILKKRPKCVVLKGGHPIDPVYGEKRVSIYV